MPGLPAPTAGPTPRPPKPPTRHTPPSREAVAGMGYRLAAGGLAGRLRAGDGGVGPCIEDAWVRQIARLWTDVTRAARGAVSRPPPETAQILPAERQTFLPAERQTPPTAERQTLAAAERQTPVVAKRPTAPTLERQTPPPAAPKTALPAARARALPIFAICQAAAAVALAAIGSSTFIYWQKSQAAGHPPGPPQTLVASAAVPHAAARETTPTLRAPPPVTALADAASPPDPLDAEPDDAAPSAASRHVPQPQAAPLRVAPPPHVFSVLATPLLPRPHRTTRAAQAQFDMPHWLTAPRGPLIMSEPPHDLALPPEYAAPVPRTPPLLTLPHVDRFAAGSYVPPMMPGAYVYR